ncbi:hypothetical protein GCM10023082_34140 [Streptomyces tremellae]|uniref:Uncharacterized protein n=1 Tax=Streptomyces tremellae TaxID=1124239 RepID=A0ABP7FEP3_9ACTN
MGGDPCRWFAHTPLGYGDGIDRAPQPDVERAPRPLDHERRPAPGGHRRGPARPARGAQPGAGALGTRAGTGTASVTDDPGKPEAEWATATTPAPEKSAWPVPVLNRPADAGGRRAPALSAAG